MAPAGAAVRSGLRTLVATLRELPQHGRLLRFLIGRMIYMDGVNTLFAFGGERNIAPALGLLRVTHQNDLIEGLGRCWRRRRHGAAPHREEQQRSKDDARQARTDASQHSWCLE